MKNARLCAFEILNSVFGSEAYSNLTLEKELKEIPQKDRAFVSALVYGVIERKITLGYLLDRLLTGKCKPKVRIILYIGAYQLYFMDKVPSSAAVNESVRLAEAVGCSYYKGLINAVLRRLDSERIDISSIDDLSVKYSCPQNLINMWTKQYGSEQTLSILECINERPPVFAVPNTLFVDSDELAYELMCDGIECEAIGDVVRIDSSFDLSKSRAYANGLFHIQDLSSYECAAALGASEGDTVLDICSAPGGKAFTAAYMMHGKGRLLAFDLHPHRVELIKQGAKRLELNNIEASVNDARVFNSVIPSADRILCDVPCSGFGIIRRKPEIRYKELDSIRELPALQLEILEVSAEYLKSGGTMIYSTCTLNKKENEKVAEEFLKRHHVFTCEYMKTVFPDKNGGDGFFYAKLIKND